MNRRNSPLFYASIALLVLLAGCVTPPAPEKAEDTRLDQLISGMDKALSNQTTASTQLQQQQQQLDLQKQQLELLSQDLGKALKAPVKSNCPKVAACPSVPKLSGKVVVGALEEVWLPDLDLALTARIDTGADTSSLDARNIELFERDGKSWVRFEILNPKSNEPVSLERRLQRTVGIVQSGASESKRRPVVKMGIIIGNNEQTAQFSLSNRSHMGYQALIGRSILKDVMVVDVSKKNIAPYTRPEKSSNTKGNAK
jgi:hypothetical protein